MISAVTVPSPACRARTPAVRQLPSTGNAISSAWSSTFSGTVACQAPEYQAGVNPSRNAMLAARANGPRGTRVNVCMRTISARPADIYGR